MRQVKNGKNSRKLAVVWGVGIIICVMSVPGWGQYGGGGGTEGDPFLISDPNHMQAIGEHEEHWAAGTWFELVNDIDLSRFTGTGFNIIGYYYSSSNKKSFKGVFDGNGNKIDNFTYSTTSAESYVGLFGYLDSGGQIKDLGLEDANVETTGDCIGGLVGYNSYGAISNCYVIGAVSGDDFLGGLVGYNEEGAISNCYATGTFIGDDRVGGLVGYNSYGAISNCYVTNSVSGDYYLGGLVGYNSYGVISNCYARGMVNGGDDSEYLGGLVGYNIFGAISNCYATGAVIGDYYLGGLVGYNWNGTVNDCYWDEESSGLSYSQGGRKKTTAQMKEAQTYVGWNDGSWVIDEVNDYPHLWWEEGASGLPEITTEYPVRTYPGNGEDQPFELDSSEDLLCMSQRTIDWDENFILTGDIDMNLVTDYYPPSDFNGYLEGAGYSVINLTIDANVIGNNYQLGLIGRSGNGGHLENLGVEEVNIIGVDYSSSLGGLVGSNGGDISNCYARGAVSGGSSSYSIGGLVGSNGGAISNCYATGAVSGDDYLGGLVGANNNSTISNCYAAGAVNGGEGSDSVGGLVGRNYQGAISNCYAIGAISGGVGSRYLGGLVGSNWSGVIRNCYATGWVTGILYLGGLVGYDNIGDYTKSFWNITVNPSLTGIGNKTDPAAVIGETTENMQKQATFTDVGWGFVGESDNGSEDIWDICEDMHYPRLAWQILDGDIVCPYGVDLLDLALLCEQWLCVELTADRAPEGGDEIVDLRDWAVLAAGWKTIYDRGDFVELMGQWLGRGARHYIGDVAPPPDGDGVVNLADYALLAANWLKDR